MNRVQQRRLLNVARACREAPDPSKFDMCQFGYAAPEGATCGTPACALGHYAARPDLQRTMRLDQSGLVLRSKDGGWRRYSHDCEHFGITPGEWSELFSCGGCGGAKTPKQAARYIERFVARKLKARDKSVRGR